MNILVTGASGMLGRYVLPILKQEDNGVTTLQRRNADIICDLTKETPDFGTKNFDLAVHAAGSHDETDALDLNFEGTRRLLDSLDLNPPKEFVFVSSWEVYSPDAGEDVKEDHPLWASTKVGQSKARAEEIVKKWSDEHNVLLTIVRPARMFGKGVKGEMKTLFNDIVNGRYIHVRDNDARLSLVCAYDVAKVIKLLHPIGGTYNIADDRGAKWIELADAMSCNSGAMKRQTFLPKKWAEVAWKTASWLPPVKASLSPEILDRRSKTLTLSTDFIKNTLPAWNPYPTLEVISRENKDYPYVD